MLQKVNLTIKSEQYSPEEGETEPLRMEQSVVARLRRTDEQVSLTYREPSDDGAGAEMQFFFFQSSPSVVTLNCRGAQRYTLTFCEGEYSSGDYALGGMTFSLAARTHRLENALLGKGVLRMEYTIELDGQSNGLRVVELTLREGAKS